MSSRIDRRPKLPGSELRLLFVGDVMLGRGVNQSLKSLGPKYPWGDTLEVFRKADWRACNLECVISDHGVPWSVTPKAFHFRSDSKNVAVLKEAKIDAVSVANNHTLDFEHEAMKEMLQLLDLAEIKHAGAGANCARAFEPAVSEVRGRRVALIAFTDNEPEWAANATQPGVGYVPIDVTDERARRLFALIGKARNNGNTVVVSAHWGPNWGYEPPKEHIRFAHRLIDEGADVIFGHSGHVFRGIEIYEQHPIMYCAGNFIDDYAVDEIERNDESFIFSVDLGGDGRPGRMRLSPTIIAEDQARLAGRRAEEIAFKMKDLCARLHTFTEWLKEDNQLEIQIR